MSISVYDRVQDIEENGFATSFGVGTFLHHFVTTHSFSVRMTITNYADDFGYLSRRNRKSTPLNIVIKLPSAASGPAVKISDKIGKNAGDKKTVEEVKQELRYIEKPWWNMGDEKNRWGERRGH